MTTRRAFFAALLGAAALDPERLLWVPGRKRIFLPPARRVSVGDCFIPPDVSWRTYQRVLQEARNAFLNGQGDLILFRPPLRR